MSQGICMSSSSCLLFIPVKRGIARRPRVHLDHSRAPLVFSQRARQPGPTSSCPSSSTRLALQLPIKPRANPRGGSTPCSIRARRCQGGCRPHAMVPFRQTGAVGCVACCLPAASQPGNLDGWASRAFLRLDAAWLGSIECWASSWNDPRQALLPIGSSWVCPTTQVSSCGGVDTGLAGPVHSWKLAIGRPGGSTAVCTCAAKDGRHRFVNGLGSFVQHISC